MPARPDVPPHPPDLSAGEKGYDGLVRSTELDYADLDYLQPVTIEEELAFQGSTRFASSIRAVKQSGYERDHTWTQRSEIEPPNAEKLTHPRH